MAKFASKPNKVQSPPKRPTASLPARLASYTGKSNKTKAFQPMKVSMRGRAS